MFLSVSAKQRGFSLLGFCFWWLVLNDSQDRQNLRPSQKLDWSPNQDWFGRGNDFFVFAPLQHVNFLKKMNVLVKANGGGWDLGLFARTKPCSTGTYKNRRWWWRPNHPHWHLGSPEAPRVPCQISGVLFFGQPEPFVSGALRQVKTL